ncbi:MAG: hypothetical protein Q8O65_05650 [Nitrosopumilaceae archaeon]|nr:hypothetical protein [Nitrosopumilaceae archaeon]
MSFYKFLLANILFDVLKEKPIDVKCITTLIIADIIKSFKKYHPIKKAVIDGIVIITARLFLSKIFYLLVI